MILPDTSLVTGTSLSPTKKRTLFSRLPLSEPTINTDRPWPVSGSSVHEAVIFFTTTLPDRHAGADYKL
jgi:hypothetical protein